MGYKLRLVQINRERRPPKCIRVHPPLVAMHDVGHSMIMRLRTTRLAAICTWSIEVGITIMHYLSSPCHPADSWLVEDCNIRLLASLSFAIQRRQTFALGFEPPLNGSNFATPQRDIHLRSELLKTSGSMHPACRISRRSRSMVTRTQVSRRTMSATRTKARTISNRR